jgi:hypothetical protein
MVSPLSIGLAMMCSTSSAYSDGAPSRLGCGTWAPSDFLASPGSDASSGVSNRPGRDHVHPDLALGQLAGDRQQHADDAAFGGGVGGLADLAVEGGHGCGADDDAALLAHQVLLEDVRLPA